jgi:hypothetical protein
MTAILVREFGATEVLKLEEIPTPQPAAGQALVRVKAAGVNPYDTSMRMGTYAIKPVLRQKRVRFRRRLVMLLQEAGTSDAGQRAPQAVGRATRDGGCQGETKWRRKGEWGGGRVAGGWPGDVDYAARRT